MLLPCIVSTADAGSKTEYLAHKEAPNGCFSLTILGYFQILGLHDWTMMRNGVAPFNGALYSTVTTSLFTVYFRDETTSILWAFVAGGGFIRLSEITTAFLSNMHNTYLVLQEYPFVD